MGTMEKIKQKTSCRALWVCFKDFEIHEELIDLPGSGIVQALHLKCSLGSEG